MLGWAMELAMVQRYLADPQQQRSTNASHNGAHWPDDPKNIGWTGTAAPTPDMAAPQRGGAMGYQGPASRRQELGRSDGAPRPLCFSSGSVLSLVGAQREKPKYDTGWLVCPER